MSKCIIKLKTKEEIEAAVELASSLKEALRILGHNLSDNTRICTDTSKVFYETCKQFGINTDKFHSHNKHRKIKTCFTCGKKLTSDNHTGYCRTCLTNHRIQEWLQTGTLNIKPWSTFPISCRQYIYDQQNGKCGICGMSDSWNDKPLKFILDHIDGNAANNSRDNLRLICPNCDSQLDTFKSKNKKSARTNRSEYY